VIVLNLVEKIALKILSAELNERQIKLWEILNEHLPKDMFVSYGIIVDAVKNYAPSLYDDFGEGSLRYTSLLLLEDLRILCYYGYLKWSIITHPKFGSRITGYKIGMKPITQEET